MRVRFTFFLLLLFPLWSCEEYEPHLIEKLQGRWESPNEPHLVLEFDKSVVRFETAQEMGTDQCGGIRWNTQLEVYNYAINSKGFETCGTGTLYQTIYECDSAVINFWIPRDCSETNKYEITFSSDDQMTLFCAEAGLDRMLIRAD